MRFDERSNMKPLAGRFTVALLMGTGVCLSLVTAPLMADDFTVNDLGDTITLTGDLSRITGSCSPSPTTLDPNGESCSWTLAPKDPTDTFVVGKEFLRHLFEPGQSIVPLDPSIESDGLSQIPEGGTQHEFGVFSADRASTCGTVEGPLGLCANETGDPQLFTSATWQTASGVQYTDQIFIKSDTTDVPEPSSILLLLTVFAVLGISMRRAKEQPRVSH